MQLYTKQTSYVKLVKKLSPLSTKKLSCIKIHSSQRHFIKQFIAFQLDQLGTLKKYLQQFLNKTKPTHAYQQIQTHIEKSKRNPHNSSTNKNRNTDKPKTNLDRLRETNLNTMVVVALTLLSQLEVVKTRVLWEDFPIPRLVRDLKSIDSELEFQDGFGSNTNSSLFKLSTQIQILNEIPYHPNRSKED